MSDVQIHATAITSKFLLVGFLILKERERKEEKKKRKGKCMVKSIEQNFEKT